MKKIIEGSRIGMGEVPHWEATKPLLVPMDAHGYLCDVRVTTYHSSLSTQNRKHHLEQHFFILTI